MTVNFGRIKIILEIIWVKYINKLKKIFLMLKNEKSGFTDSKEGTILVRDVIVWEVMHVWSRGMWNPFLSIFLWT